MAISVKLIKDFEDLELEAYPDPAHGWSVPTIGYGTTVYPGGTIVRPNDIITESLAEEYLMDYVENKILPVYERKIPTWSLLNDNQKSALVSFGYNLGPNFYGLEGFDTITKALSSKDFLGDVPDALMLYVNPGTNVEEGLKRRRRAEANLWNQPLPSLFSSKTKAPPTTNPTMPTIINLLDVKKYYKELPHQRDAVFYLGEKLLSTPAAEKLNLRAEMDWIDSEDEDLEWLQRQLEIPPASTLHKFTELWRADKIPSVNSQAKYFSQRDNKIKPYVSCNSSSHAMFCDYVLRTKLGQEGFASDDTYVCRVYSGKYGTYGSNNSLSWDIQIKVCKSFGVKAQYSNKGKQALIREITENEGICPLNIFHRGAKPSNRSGGHVVVAVDYDPVKGFKIFDPFGSYPPTYSNKKNGTYWLPEKEFNWRFQGIFTKFTG